MGVVGTYWALCFSQGPGSPTSLLALFFSMFILKKQVLVVHLSAFFFFLLEQKWGSQDPVDFWWLLCGPVPSFIMKKTRERTLEPKKGIEPLFYRHEWYVLTI